MQSEKALRWHIHSLLSCAIVFFFSSCSSTHSKADNSSQAFIGYQMVQSLALTQGIDGVDGTLEVLRDDRLTSDDMKQIKEHDPDQNLLEGARFKNDPAKVAVLRLKSLSGKFVAEMKLEKVDAELTTQDLRDGDHRIIFLTQDYSTGMGSYNGPTAQILEVGPTNISWAKAIDARTGEKIKISLMQNLKTGWGFRPNKAGRGMDILKASCRPTDLSNANGDLIFDTTYSRFHRDHQEWTVTKRTRKNEFWENEGPDSFDEGSLSFFKKFPQ
jgi:hypothetical protein